MQNSKLQKGFTRIQVLTIIVVIGILAYFFLPSIIEKEQVSRDSQRKSDLSQIQKALEVYHQSIGIYPPNSTTGPRFRVVRLDKTTADWGYSFSPFMDILPKDPSSSRNYIYLSTGQSYYLYASLERRSHDPQICNNLDPNGECFGIRSNGIAANSCGQPCNYGVSSPNTSP